MTSGSSAGSRSLIMRSIVNDCASKNAYIAFVVVSLTCSRSSENSLKIALVTHKKQPCRDVVKPLASLFAISGRRGSIAVRYEMIILRQVRQIRSHIGVKSMKVSTMVAKIGKTSLQYSTAGFSVPGSTYGTTNCTKIVMSCRWSAKRISVVLGVVWTREPTC